MPNMHKAPLDLITVMSSQAGPKLSMHMETWAFVP